ncbi:hypothetical protein TRFO_00973 [Tritrichomonas foetus]|uniref:SCP domain-containing protein n=1 Tax=Tritrichomonas foetus TaxID=1144522 RepID=A0A1J4L3L8_9EUKA|nr:hypothetical protein TRFO_00973 [Tritrichomonas foetus]|eukprot:OHT17672.1 hypothetical protein TRFO_00973 [Tritrichomonas foetus]
MSRSQQALPENILKRIFDGVNQVRSQYSHPQLGFSKELSFIAGEFAVKMSLEQVPTNHEGFLERQCQAPLAIAFSENIAIIPETSKDPGHDAIVQWVSKPMALARINSSFTHTGVGAAESDTGVFYITQVFAIFKNRHSKKDELLIANRFINRIRKGKNVQQLSLSFVASSRLLHLSIENLLGLTVTSSKMMFQNCYEADVIIEKFAPSENNMGKFFEHIALESNEPKLLKKEFNEMGFAMKKNSSGTEIVCILALARCQPPYRALPYYQSNFPIAYNSLQLINDYRYIHSMKTVYISHQWCHIADDFCDKMINHSIDVDTSYLIRKINHYNPGSTVNCGIYVIPMCLDPLRELFAIWISSPKYKAYLLDANLKHVGFGMKIHKDSICFATLITGEKKGGETAPYHVYDFFPGDQLIYESMTSDSSDDEGAPEKDSTFRLTG